MDQPHLHNLKYGIIYLYSDRSLLPGPHDPEAIVKKFVHPLQVKWIDEPGREDLLLIARRFNVGNMGQYATVSLTLSRMNRSGGWFEAIRHFADALMGFSDAGEGNIEFHEYDFGNRYEMHSSVFGEAPTAAPQDKTRVSKTQSLKDKASKWLFEMTHAGVTSAPQKKYNKKAKSEPDLLDDEKLEISRIERERKRELEEIRLAIINYISQYHEDPKDLMAELLRGKVVVGTPGRLLVNGDLKIVLPELDEMEIQMPAMCRTLYILFMKKRKQGGEGIVLKNIDDYRDEIIDIYRMVKPGANENRVEQTVDNLCDPFGDSLNQTISRINRCIRNVITDKKLAKQYIITGNRGETYGIALAPEHMELPRAVMG
jgi:hypothetical protein